ncbi:hypothetical protein B0H19DRAFT_1067949 [Mycena capillaripes]|nr:hypothetical protein B0H19DRAFT_1067949 [Mycena capillaripes]
MARARASPSTTKTRKEWHLRRRVSYTVMDDSSLKARWVRWGMSARLHQIVGSNDIDSSNSSKHVIREKRRTAAVAADPQRAEIYLKGQPQSHRARDFRYRGIA